MDDTHGGATVQETPVTFLTPKDLQRELQIGEKLCYRLLKAGVIPSVRVGGLYRIPRKQLEEALLGNPNVAEKRIRRRPTKPGSVTPHAKEVEGIVHR
jgi:excisionase family DNA binding protein